MNLIEASSLAENGNFYPTLLLCLKELETLKGQVSTMLILLRVLCTVFASFKKRKPCVVVGHSHGVFSVQLFL